jgi:RimJ/RimL family protein N-acetyltransferase
MILTGKYVRLRPLTVDDAEVTLAWRMSDRASLLHRGAETAEAQRDWIASREGEYNFVMELLDGRPVGMISLIGITETQAESARFLIGEPQLVALYGPGRIAADAQWLLFRFAFDSLGVRKLVGTVNAANTGSLKWHLLTGWITTGADGETTFIELPEWAYRSEGTLKLMAGEK